MARVVPATHQVLLMSIPRDLWVNIPGNVPDISGMNRINSAFNNGPSLLVQTIEDDLGIPINDFAEINFPGLEGMVNSLGGIYLDFSMPVKDSYSGLNITKTGCQLVNGTQALALVRSRHLFYFQNGTWNADVQSDFSRIQRQDVFFRAMITRSHQKITDPLLDQCLPRCPDDRHHGQQCLQRTASRPGGRVPFRRRQRAQDRDTAHERADDIRRR